MDWPVDDNRALEEEMYKCKPVSCGGSAACQDMKPLQTDEEMYEINSGLNGKPALPEDRAGFCL